MKKSIRIVARSTDPETSHEAAAAFEQEKAQRSVRTVVAILEDYGVLTDFELSDLWPQYWEGPFSQHLPRNARHWARENGLVKHVGYGRHLKRRCRKWALGQDDMVDPVECPCCERKTRSESVIEKITANTTTVPW